MELDITIADSTTFYRPVLELFNDGKAHKNSEIIDEIRKMLPKNERDNDKVEAWVNYPIKHFYDAGCLEKLEIGLHRITKDGEALLNKDLESLDRKVLKKYCPKYREKYENSSVEDDVDNYEDSIGEDSIGEEIMSEDITFIDALNIIKKVLSKVGTTINADDYDMLLVKQLPDADILKKNKSDQTKGKTAHIALTGDKMDIFPFLEAYGYFYNEPGESDIHSKGRFLLEVPVYLYMSNLRYLSNHDPLEEDRKIPTTVTVVRNRKNDPRWTWDKFKNQVDGLEDAPYRMRLKLLGYDVQTELSGTLSGNEFKYLRNLLYRDYYLVILKCKDMLQYDILAIKPSDGEPLSEINYTLFVPKQKTVTLVSSNLWSTEENLANIIDGGENRLIYGVPGSGKSWTIKNEICDDVDESSIKRVVFHPDYTYADFVGQILPEVTDDKVKYKFTRGPFTEILAEACSKPWKKFYLIIEEINRGNAPAIFGDIFQLLDRKDKATDDFPVGTSEYAINNSYISDEVYGKGQNRKIRIPSNLNIIATMNTADQNVFTLDTAFQRRWNMQLIPNKFKEDHEFADDEILDSSVTWRDFVDGINELILKKNTLTTSSEDKRVGVYFINEEDLDDENSFAEKVLKYLWDDAFKFSRDKIFIKECDSLETVIELFTSSEGNGRFDIFIDKESLISENSDGEPCE